MKQEQLSKRQGKKVTGGPKVKTKENSAGPGKVTVYELGEKNGSIPSYSATKKKG